MKNKIAKISLLSIIITLLLLTISQIIHVEIISIPGKVSDLKALNTTPTLVEGETDPNTYFYKTNVGPFDATEAGAHWIPTVSGFRIFCIEPGAELRYPTYGLTYEDALALVNAGPITTSCGCVGTPTYEGYETFARFVPDGSTQDLPPALAYILSDNRDIDFQEAVWHMGEGVIIGSGTSGSDSGVSTVVEEEAAAYANYDGEVREQGLKPQDLTGETIVLVDQTTQKYIAGPFSVKYTNGQFGDVAFSGISEITLNGYDVEGNLVKQNIPVEEIILSDTATGVYGQAVTPKYFEPDDNKIDRKSQVYPKSGQSFKVVFSDPNSEDVKIHSVTVKIKFKYMLATGKYQKLKGTIYKICYRHDHSYNPHTHVFLESSYSCSGCSASCYLEQRPQQELMVADAIRTLYEQEIELGRDNPAVIDINLSGYVWEDVPMSKESLADGHLGGEDIRLGNIKVTLLCDGEAIDTTLTDANGYYEFKHLNAMKKYKVTFEYNGQTYMPTEYLVPSDNTTNSKAKENPQDRTSFDEKFREIGAGFVASATEMNATTVKEYPEPNKFTISNSGTASYPPVYDDIYYVNLGLWRRQEFDLALRKDVAYAATTINGKTEVYKYDKRGSNEDYWQIALRIRDYENYYGSYYTRALYPADYNYKSSDNHNGAELELYITYKITIRNMSQSILGQVRELVDYYDEDYTYMDNLSWVMFNNSSAVTPDSYYNVIHNQSASSLGDNAKETKSSTSSKYGASTQQNGIGNNLYIRGLENYKLKVGEEEYVYLTFKVNKNNNGKIKLDNDNTFKQNYAEINGHSTYYQNGTQLPNYGTVGEETIAGLLDIDSTPGNLTASDILAGGQYEQNFEDDTDRAKSIKVTVEESYIREINGNTWEDERNKKVAGAIIGDGVMQDKEAKISGVTVELVERIENNAEYVWATTVTDKNGHYEFKNNENKEPYIIPGTYFVRFKYGDTSETVLIENNNGTSYNGQDFKSTVYQKDMKDGSTIDDENDKYNITKADNFGKNVSDAKDIWERREKVNSYSTSNVKNNIAEVLASPYTKPVNQNNINELIKNTYMVAKTALIEVEGEYNRTTTDGYDDINNNNSSDNNYLNGKYTLKNLDFGLVERPKAQLEVSKKVTHVKLTLANGTVLFDANQGVTNLIWTKDMIAITMDEELMHGATIKITYDVAVKNIGEIDYEGEEFYYKGTGASEDKKVTTIADVVVDYVANNLKYRNDDDKDGNWSLVQSPIAEEGVNGRLQESITKFNTFIRTDKLAGALKPGESKTTSLILSQLITPENTEDDRTYDNLVEITSISNSVGRRMAYSIQGNQDPTIDPQEVDSAKAEKVVILPPFGIGNIITYVAVAIAALVLLTTGIIFIKKKVINK